MPRYHSVTEMLREITSAEYNEAFRLWKFAPWGPWAESLHHARTLRGFGRVFESEIEDLRLNLSERPDEGAIVEQQVEARNVETGADIVAFLSTELERLKGAENAG